MPLEYSTHYLGLIGEMFLDLLRERECDLDGREDCVVSISSSTGGESD